MGRPKITLYVDVVSPFAYQAYHLLRNDPLFRDVTTTITPIFLGGLMHKCGNTPPIAIKNKDKWINQERLRWSAHFDIPISETLPPGFPAPTLPVGRVLATFEDQERLTRLLDVLFRKHWVEGVPVHRGDVLGDVVREVFGGEADSILAEAATKGKKRLIENTDKAFAEGAFGLPWMVCEDADGKKEGFWGVDHMGQVVQFLGLDRAKGGKGWKAVL